MVFQYDGPGRRGRGRTESLKKIGREVIRSEGERATYLNEHPFRRLSGIPKDIIEAEDLPQNLQRRNQQEEKFVACLKDLWRGLDRDNINQRILNDLRQNIGFCSFCQCASGYTLEIQAS
jgi:hypothetical protein